MKLIQIYKPNFNKKEYLSLSDTLKSGWISNGVITKKFEINVKKKLKINNVIAVNSCTSGIYAVLTCLNLKKGDEVITTLLTYISTIHSLYALNLKIKFIDVEKKDFSMSLDQLKKNITKKTKLVLVNHYAGIPSNIQEITKICKKNKIHLVEDAATALGAKFKNKLIGSNDYSTTVFSLQANKIITTGDGGIITTNNNILAKKVREKISNGFNNKNDVVVNGFKFNFTDMQASIGIAQLQKLNKFINYRNELRKLYDRELKILKEKNLIFLYENSKNVKISQYIYTILINDKKNNQLRNKLKIFLSKKNIETKVHYLTANFTSFYKKKLSYKNINNSIYISKNILSLPFHNLLNEKQIKYICSCIRLFFNIK